MKCSNFQTVFYFVFLQISHLISASKPWCSTFFFVWSSSIDGIGFSIFSTTHARFSREYDTVKMPRRLAATCNRELEVANCSLDHDFADSMVRSQWQSRSRNNYYLLYRWLVAIFVTFVVLYSFIDSIFKYTVGYFFIYFTHWGILINMVVGLIGAILVTVWHFHDDFHGNIHWQQFILYETICTQFVFVHSQKTFWFEMMRCQSYLKFIGHCTILHWSHRSS